MYRVFHTEYARSLVSRMALTDLAARFKHVDRVEENLAVLCVLLRFNRVVICVVI